MRCLQYKLFPDPFGPVSTLFAPNSTSLLTNGLALCNKCLKLKNARRYYFARLYSCAYLAFSTLSTGSRQSTGLLSEKWMETVAMAAKLKHQSIRTVASHSPIQFVQHTRYLAQHLPVPIDGVEELLEYFNFKVVDEAVNIADGFIQRQHRLIFIISTFACAKLTAKFHHPTPHNTSPTCNSQTSSTTVRCSNGTHTRNPS